jgi:L-malate glycosyltransferase
MNNLAKKKICSIGIFYDLVYPYTIGGGEKRFYEIAEQLAKNGYKVHYICQKFWSGENIINQNGVIYHGISPCDTKYITTGERSFLYTLRYAIATIRFILRNKLDIYDFCNIPYLHSLLGSIVCLFLKRKYCITWLEYTGSGWNKIVKPPYNIIGNIIEKLLLKVSNNTIAISNFTLGRLIDAGIKSNNYSVISYGTNKGYIVAENTNFSITFCGRIQPHKNVYLIFEAVKKLVDQYDIIINIVGKGSSLESIINLSKNLELYKNTNFISELSEDDLDKTLRESRVFILPSEREGLSLVVIEALRSGIPVITVNCEFNAAKELVINGYNGYVVNPNSSDLAEAIKSIFSKSSQIWRENCLKYSTEFNINNVIDKIKSFYKKM